MSSASASLYSGPHPSLNATKVQISRKRAAPLIGSNGRGTMYSQPDTGGLSKDEIRQAFGEFDLDRNGYVGAAEIAHVLASMGEKVTDDEIDEMILMADTDGDGQISFDEFHKLMYQLSLGSRSPRIEAGWACKRRRTCRGRGQAPYGQPPNTGAQQRRTPARTAELWRRRVRRSSAHGWGLR